MTIHQVSSLVKTADVSWGGVLLDDALDLSFVCRSVLLEESVGISLSWRIGIGIVEQVLNPQKNLLDGDCRLPTLLFIQNRETDRARWIDVGMEQRRDESA